MSIVVSKFKVFLVIFVFFCGFSSAKAVSAANSSEFSVSISIKASSVASKSIVAKAEEFRLVTNASGYPMCQIMSGSSWQTALVSSVAISADTWAHIVCTYDENELKIFVNGEETGSSDLSAAMDDTANMLKIGTDDSSGSTYGNLAGVVDEFKFFNYALSADEIKEEYNSGSAFVMGGAETADDNGTTVTGASIEYCIPGDTATCSPPVLELKFDKKSGSVAYDTSGQGNDGTISGATHSQGKKGAGLSFDGVDDYVKVDDDSVFSPYGDGSQDAGLTFEAWIKPNDPFSTSDQSIISKTANSSECRFYQKNGNHLYFDCWEESYHTVYYRVYAGNVLNSEWNHVVAVLNYKTDHSGNAKIYVNGMLAGIDTTNGTTTPITDTDSDIFIGSRNSGSDRYDGLIDNVRIYNYARTGTQIAWDYNRGKPIAHYKFDECSGSVIHDESGNGNHGTLNLGTTGVTATGTCASSSDSFWYNGRVGKRNGSGDFDGESDYIALVDDMMDDYVQSSVGMWFKSNDVSATYQNLFSYSDQASIGYIVALFVSNSRLRLQTKNSSGNVHFCDGGTILDDNIWYQVIWVEDDGWQVFLNGEEESFSCSEGNMSTNWDFSSIGSNAETATIGALIRDGGSVLNYFNGQIDDVRIYNYAMTAEQVRNVFNDGAVSFK